MRWARSQRVHAQKGRAKDHAMRALKIIAPDVRIVAKAFRDPSSVIEAEFIYDDGTRTDDDTDEYEEESSQQDQEREQDAGGKDTNGDQEQEGSEEVDVSYLPFSLAMHNFNGMQPQIDEQAPEEDERLDHESPFWHNHWNEVEKLIDRRHTPLTKESRDLMTRLHIVRYYHEGENQELADYLKAAVTKACPGVTPLGSQVDLQQAGWWKEDLALTVKWETFGALYCAIPPGAVLISRQLLEAKGKEMYEVPD